MLRSAIVETESGSGAPISDKAGPRRIALVFRAVAIAAALVLFAGAAYVAVGAWRERAETARTTTRFDPPVWAGQNFIVPCAGGFYARQESTIVLVISAHCGEPGLTLRNEAGEDLGVLGPRAQLADCPAGRFCAPSDILTLALAAGRIPWGHLNVVDMGAGGYRTIEAGTRPLACSEIAVGDRFEINGRDHYRSGTVVATGPYQYETDTMFPCILVGDTKVTTGDSGAAVLVNGLPAGVVARELGARFGFTPLAEGLDNLGLRLCASPDCDLSPELATQP